MLLKVWSTFCDYAAEMRQSLPQDSLSELGQPVPKVPGNNSVKEHSERAEPYTEKKLLQINTSWPG